MQVAVVNSRKLSNVSSFTGSMWPNVDTPLSENSDELNEPREPKDRLLLGLEVLMLECDWYVTSEFVRCGLPGNVP
jgi:hypothetical protein